MPKLRSTTEEFIKKSIKTHGNKYDYSKSIYINKRTKIEIICPVHGGFWQSPNSHIRGTNCKKCSQKQNFTTEMFIAKAKKQHGDKYDYSKSIYISSRIKIKIKCHKHGYFKQRPGRHYRGNGCNICASEYTAKIHSFSTQHFINESIILHGDKYDYSCVNYKNRYTKIKIICKKHGEFLQVPQVHLRSHGCPSCAQISRNISKSLTNEEFIEQANIIHNNKYDYSITNYINTNTKIKIICPNHGEFLQTPANHLQKRGCRKCIVRNSFTCEEFIEKASKMHANKYDYSLVNYSNIITKIKIICKKHGEFLQKPSNHLYGTGCPKCAAVVSKAETYWLNTHNIPNDYRQYSLKINGRLIKADGFDPETNTIYEYYGDFWHGNPKIYNPEDINKANHKPFGQLYQDTLEREILIKSAGYNLISKWETPI